MENTKQGILPKNFSLNEKYSVILFIKHGSNAETYRVKGKDGKLYFLKLFSTAGFCKPSPHSYFIHFSFIIQFLLQKLFF